VTPRAYWTFWLLWSAGSLIAFALVLYFVVTKPIVAALLAGKGQ
jgi:hypothetical protein